MKTIYNVKSTIKYPKMQNGETSFDLRTREFELKEAIEKFNTKHMGKKHLELKNIEENLLEFILESSDKLNESNMGKELTYLSRVLKSEYGWGSLSKYDTAFLNVEEIKQLNKRGRKKKEDSFIDREIENIKETTTNLMKQKDKKSISKVKKGSSNRVSKTTNTNIDHIVNLGKELVDESFKMSVSELMIMKEETNSLIDMKNIVDNLESIISLLESNMQNTKSSLV